MEKIKTGITNTSHYHEVIDKALQEWLLEAEKTTKELVDNHWESIKILSKVLIEKEVVYENELDDIKLKTN